MTEEDLSRIILQDQDVPPEIATLSQTTVTYAGGKSCSLPGEQPGTNGSTLVSRSYDAPEPFPQVGAQRVIVTSALHSSDEGAKGEFECLAASVSQGDLERLLKPEWHLFSYEDIPSMSLGEEQLSHHYIAVNAEGLVFLESYWSTFRRGKVTAVLNIRAPLGNISEEQFGTLAKKLDQRVQEGLLSLQ